MSPKSDNLTAVQKEVLTNFRLMLKDIVTPEHTDAILIKWLRVVNFNLKQAEKNFRVNYYNRLMLEMDSLLNTYKKPEVAQLHDCTGALGFAKDGSVIRYTAFGPMDLIGFIMSLPCSQISLLLCHFVEFDLKAVREESLKRNQEVNEITFVIDLEGFSIQQILHKIVVEMGLEFARLVQECYPDVYSNILIVNASMIFDKIFNFFKPILGSHIMDKIKVASSESSKELLLQYIDEDVLPVFLGGKRVDSNGDPRCREFISCGGKIPEKFYVINNCMPLTTTDPRVTYVNIAPRSVYNYIVMIKEGDCRIRIQNRFENGTLSYTLFHKDFRPELGHYDLPEPYEYIDENDENSKFKQVSVTIKVHSHYSPEDCIMYLKWPGIYVFRLGNAGSWFTSRKLAIRHKVIPPEAEISL